MKTKCIRVDGIICKILPNGFYRVQIKNKNAEVLAYLSGKLAKKNPKPVVGESVVMEMSPTDITKGRIVEKES